MDFYKQMEEGTKNAKKRIREVITELFDRNADLKWTIEPTEGYCVRLRNKEKPNLWFSVSAVKVMEWNSPNTKVLETALWDGGVIYNSKLGYDDVCGHDNVDSLLEDLERVCNIEIHEPGVFVGLESINALFVETI